MKKLFTTLIILCITTVASSQKSITKEVGNFTEVKVFDRIVINLIKSNENKVIISGEDASQVQIINKDGKLKIRMDLGLTFDGKNTFVNLYYKRLEIIDGNEGSYISSTDLIDQDQLEVKAQEGARIELALQVREANFKAVSGSVIEVTGVAQQQDIKINTGSSFKGKDFKTEHTTVFLQAGGRVEAFASKKANITVRAGGDVVVYGKPEDVTRKRNLGGNIKIM